MTDPSIRTRIRTGTQPRDRPVVFKRGGRWVALWAANGLLPDGRPNWKDYIAKDFEQALGKANRLAEEIAASRRRVERGP